MKDTTFHAPLSIFICCYDKITIRIVNLPSLCCGHLSPSFHLFNYIRLCFKQLHLSNCIYFLFFCLRDFMYRCIIPQRGNKLVTFQGFTIFYFVTLSCFDIFYCFQCFFVYFLYIIIFLLLFYYCTNFSILSLLNHSLNFYVILTKKEEPLLFSKQSLFLL